MRLSLTHADENESDNRVILDADLSHGLCVSAAVIVLILEVRFPYLVSRGQMGPESGF